MAKWKGDQNNETYYKVHFVLDASIPALGGNIRHFQKGLLGFFKFLRSPDLSSGRAPSSHGIFLVFYFSNCILVFYFRYILVFVLYADC